MLLTPLVPYRNRLTNATERATYGGSATKATDFAYDYLNRLVSESADPDGAGEQGADETYFAYDGNQVALQFNGSESGDLAHRYLWGPAVDQVLADEQITSLNNAGDVLWPLTDNLGTVRDLATYDSQQDETTIANHRVFDAYGNLTSETNSAVDHLFGFTGRQCDEATGLQNNLNRWYDPIVGGWLSQDPIGFNAGDGNLYRYVTNRPTGLLDPSGEAEQPFDPSYPSNPYAGYGEGLAGAQVPASSVGTPAGGGVASPMAAAPAPAAAPTGRLGSTIDGKAYVKVKSVTIDDPKGKLSEDQKKLVKSLATNKYTQVTVLVPTFPTGPYKILFKTPVIPFPWAFKFTVKGVSLYYTNGGKDAHLSEGGALPPGTAAFGPFDVTIKVERKVEGWTIWFTY